MRPRLEVNKMRTFLLFYSSKFKSSINLNLLNDKISFSSQKQIKSNHCCTISLESLYYTLLLFIKKKETNLNTKNADI